MEFRKSLLHYLSKIYTFHILIVIYITEHTRKFSVEFLMDVSIKNMLSNKNPSTGFNADGEDQVAPRLQKGHWLVLQPSSLAEDIWYLEGRQPWLNVSADIVNILGVVHDEVYAIRCLLFASGYMWKN